MFDYNTNNNGTSNNNNNGTSNNNNRHHTTTRRQSNEETLQTFPEDQTLDTYMTKPREIKFDANDDDVSALFGGGGASQLGGVESYRGTYAKKRQGKGNIVMSGNNNYNNSKPKKRNIEEDSRRTGGTSTFQSHGVNSILEEIGLRTKSPSSYYNKKRESFSEEDETWDEGGDESAYPQSRTVQSRLTRGTELTGQSTTPRRRKRNSTSGGLGDIKTKNMIVAIVGIVFITIQFTTVNKRDRHVMQSMKQQGRFNNRYATAPHARGQEGLSNADMEKMRRMAEKGNQRRRGGSMAQQNDEDGLGDVLRKTVLLVGQPHKKESWEREQIMFDDAIEDNQQQQLRGNKKMSDMMNQKQKLEQQKLQQQMRIQQQQLDLQKKQMQLQQQQMAQQQQQMAIPKQQDPPKANDQQQQLSPPQKQMEVGDTHPLLAPGKLSMEKGPDIVGADKLADIDPRPQQSLSNDIIPKRYQVFADLRTPYTKGRDTPFFWHIPRSGGVIVKTMLSHCLGQTLAAEVGA